MKKPLVTILIFWVALVMMPSIPRVRSILAAPLVVTDENASGEACYVLAAGNAIWERLAAASDLYHMKRVPKIIIMSNNDTSHYSFPAHASWSGTQWYVEYLSWRGVPKENIQIIEEVKGPFGTLNEARNIAKILPPNAKRLVLVTSAPHTRRSLLAFKKSLPPGLTIIPFAATNFEASAEMHHPLWLEYLKLLVYKTYLFL
jgi:uncharacterized SAM-binding protein YcdF (DUF218 family)